MFSQAVEAIWPRCRWHGGLIVCPPAGLSLACLPQLLSFLRRLLMQDVPLAVMAKFMQDGGARVHCSRSPAALWHALADSASLPGLLAADNTQPHALQQLLWQYNESGCQSLGIVTALHQRSYAVAGRPPADAPYCSAGGVTPRKVFNVGHCGGGAAATVTALWMALQCPTADVRCVTFGSPKVGNAAFTEVFRQDSRVLCLAQPAGILQLGLSGSLQSSHVQQTQPGGSANASGSCRRSARPCWHVWL